MTATDRLNLLKEQVAQKGQAQVARELHYSATTINQIMHGSYAGSTEKVLQKVYEVYGGEIVSCPVLGEIPLARCAHERKQPFKNTNRQAVLQYRACATCGRNV